jgi:hypothetical protein
MKTGACFGPFNERIAALDWASANLRGFGFTIKEVIKP